MSLWLLAAAVAAAEQIVLGILVVVEEQVELLGVRIFQSEQEHIQLLLVLAVLAPVAA
jgi:hypothetical protein